MARNPAFELFENLCAELAIRPTQVITEDDVHPSLMEDVSEHFAQSLPSIAFRRALESLQTHFEERSSTLPFEVELETREFRATDSEFLEFVAFAKANRSIAGAKAKEFEIRILHRLQRRLTGDLRCVGAPRGTYRRKREYSQYLEGLGFDRNCLDPRDKDGGLDIIWSPPLGATPLRPIVSVQCKNSYFDEDEANVSVGRAKSTLNRHSHLRGEHLKFVVFNDYIDRAEFMGKAVGWSFVPLGLTDLAVASRDSVTEVL